jgi:sigma-B regulation protein RsbU (phosphoserine phosphatase)
MRAVPHPAGGAVFVMDGDGRIVASSPAAATSDPLIAGTARSFAPGIRAGTFGDSVAADFEAGGERVLAVVTPVPPPAALLIVSVAPLSEYLADVHAARWRSLGFAAGIVLVAVSFGLLLALYVARPITELAQHLRRIGRGKLDEEILLTEFPEFMRLSFAVNNMVEGLRENMKLRDSLNMVMEVQQRLLPAEVPSYPGLDLAGRSYYCDETGGDYYDFLRINAFPDTTAVVAIGDVSGHGIASAMVMAAARSLLRSRCHDARSLADVLGTMNGQIVEDSGGGRYMTMLLTAVDAVAGELRWVSAGHRPPLLLEPGAAAFTALDGADIPLGIDAAAVFHEHAHRGLRSGQLILLATDGLWEAANSAGELYGLDRLAELMHGNAHCSAREICAAIALAQLQFCGTMAQKDDISFVVIKVT